MECKEAGELLGPFLLGALEQGERELLEAHLAECGDCEELIQVDGETVAKLAMAAPRMVAPNRVRCKLLRRVDEDMGRQAAVVRALRRFAASFSAFAVSQPGRAAASVFIMAIVAVGIWVSFRPPSTPAPDVQLASVPPTPVVVTSSPAQAPFAPAVSASANGLATPLPLNRRDIFNQSYSPSYVRGTAVSLLHGSGWTAGARGMILSSTGRDALLVTKGVPPPPAGSVYQIWLIKGGAGYRAGTLEVDSTGYGEAVIISVVPLIEFDAIGITIEPKDGSEGPTGASVLKGDL